MHTFLNRPPMVYDGFMRKVEFWQNGIRPTETSTIVGFGYNSVRINEHRRRVVTFDAAVAIAKLFMKDDLGRPQDVFVSADKDLDPRLMDAHGGNICSVSPTWRIAHDIETVIEHPIAVHVREIQLSGGMTLNRLFDVVCTLGVVHPTYFVTDGPRGTWLSWLMMFKCEDDANIVKGAVACS